jgi:cysteine desulfurase/selenocysteine lyase
MEGARATVASFIGSSDPLEVVFTRGTTEGLNLVANAWGRTNLKPGDELLIGLSEHSSNMLP